MKHLKQRRQRALAEIGDGLAVFFGGAAPVRNHDVHYPFRQDSDMKYLTGLDEPHSVLLLTGSHPPALFVRPKDPQREMWDGRRPGPEGAGQESGIERAYPLEKFEETFAQYLPGHRKIFGDLYHPKRRERLFDLVARCASKERAKQSLRPHQFADLGEVMGRLRLIKDAASLDLMRKAARISCQAHLAAMAWAGPDKTEGQLQALLEFVMGREGTGIAYPSIVAGGENALVLHYTDNAAPLAAGDLTLIDAGAEWDCHASDITRTFPVSGRFSGPQREMYQVVLEGQKRAIAEGKPGKTLEDIHRCALGPIVAWLLEKGILAGEAGEIIEKKGYKDFYVHGTGHWLGLDVHDRCPYLDVQEKPIKLAAGMVYTVEPGLYFAADDERVPAPFRGLGIRIEDDILVTPTGVENFSAELPKEVAAVEEACQGDLPDNCFPAQFPLA